MGYAMLSNDAKGERIKKRLRKTVRELRSVKFEAVRSQKAGAIN
jgi:5S rRNA maturation endonuclease (ribonuclease M5)